MAVALTKALLTAQLRSEEVLGQAEAQAKLAEELSKRMGVDVLVEEIPDLRHFGCADDHYASFEWSEGGMIHGRCCSVYRGVGGNSSNSFEFSMGRFRRKATAGHPL